MDPNVEAFVSSRRIAVVGASRQAGKFGTRAAGDLEARGYQVCYVHPQAEAINGKPCLRSLAEAKTHAEALWVCVPPERGAQVLRDAAGAGFKNVWLQQGADSPELISLGEQLGLKLVSGKCILMYAEPVTGFHKFHQVVWKLIGQY
jgi:predicted CoA-binding protein